jgi:hypothetical protein
MDLVHDCGEAAFGWMGDPDRSTRTSDGEAQ